MTNVPATTWFLRGRIDSMVIKSTPVRTDRFLVGRKAECAMSLTSPAVSSIHAELYERDAELFVVDLDSTNGTFLNGVPVHEAVQLKDGDLLQFADMAFRVCRQNNAPPTSKTLTSGADGLAETAFSLVQFDRLISERSVIPHYQPLVRLPERTVFGYEVLGRSRLVGLETPSAMFLAASQLNMEAELSEMLRAIGTTGSAKLPGTPAIFLNTHPSEVAEFGLLESLTTMRENHPELDIVLEMHEASVTKPDTMRMLRRELNKLNIGLAYDDFGSGQSRLRDIIDVPPDCLKFDISLIHGIDSAGCKRQDMLASLVRSVRDMGIMALAEGVETAGEHETVESMGFNAAQGFYYGRPVARPVDHAPEECLV